MIESTQVVSYGREASEALARAIADAQREDPLAAVTVVVASNFVGLSMRRLIGSGVVGASGRRGLANVSFITPFQLAERVGADLLLDTRPITTPVLGAAVRRVLADDPGPYALVAKHESTEAALAGLFAELSNVDEAGLEAMLDEGSTAAALAVGFHRRINEHLAGFHTESDLVTAAADRADLANRLEPFGEFVLFLPAPTTQPVGRFLSRVLADAPSRVVVGLTGAPDADAPVVQAVESLGVNDLNVARPEPVVGDHIVSVTDPAEEVREVCSRVLSLLADGVEAHRIAVVFSTPDPYVRILEQQFRAAGVPVNGPDPRRMADSVAGRTLLGALALPQGRWRRDRVMAVVSGGPVRFGDGRARPNAWDRLSREAGVVGDLGDWLAKLATHETRLRERRDRQRSLGQDEVASRADADLDDLSQLARFVDGLATSVSAVTSAPSWPDKCREARDLLVSLLGPEHRRGRWPEAEQDAFARVEDALARLASLDAVEPNPPPDVFLRALRNELDVARRRNGRFGHGVLYAPVGAAIGLDLDAVFVVGAAEGSLPVPRRDDATLPEAVRMASLDQLEPRRERLHHQHRALLAALAAAPVGQRTLLFPRGSLRSSRQSLPSRWLLDTASVLAGRRIHATDFDELGSEVIETVGSFASGIIGPGPATSVEERDAAAMPMGPGAERHPLAALVGRGLELQRARSSSQFTEFDGNLAGANVSVGARPMSPSRLETWASCGFRYFLQYVLDAAGRDDPERLDDISALDRGSLVHAVLERFVGEAISNGSPAPGQSWSPRDRDRLHEIAAVAAEELERSGRTGRAVQWRVRLDEMHDLLDHFLRVDDAFRAAHGVRPHDVELDLGVRDGAPVRIDLGTGRSLAMRGLADRVDVSDDGRLAVVSDYKTGAGAKYGSLDEDPFNAGTCLQLGMYAEGAARETGAESVRTDYWLVEAGSDVRRGYDWTSTERERFHEVLGAILDGVERGVFDARPGEWSIFRRTNENCAHCDFDSVCVRNRGDQAEAKAGAEQLRVLEQLIPAPPSDDEGAS